jgi:glycosyltransferase involved in cell wall biosynthesis
MEEATSLRKIRIFFLIHQFAQGGAEQQLFELVKGINKHKFDVTVGCLVPGGEKSVEFQSLPGVRVLCFDQKHKFNLFVIVKILAFLIRRPVDIIHTYLAPATSFGTLVGLITRTPVLIMAERGAQMPLSRIGSKIYFLLENFLARYIDIIIANSVAGKNWRIELGVHKEKIAVVQNGINPDRMRKESIHNRQTLGIDNRCVVIGSVARLDPMKDHYTLLKAVKLVTKEYPQMKCLLLGDGPLRKQLEQEVNELRLNNNVIFLGNQNHVADFIEIFDIAVLSSKYTEGSSNFILEAMYCRKPVVATDVGGTGALVIDGVTGFLVPKEDPQALSSAIVRLVSSRALRENLGRSGYQRVKQEFMVDQMIKRTEVIYQELFLHNRRSISACEKG